MTAYVGLVSFQAGTIITHLLEDERLVIVAATDLLNLVVIILTRHFLKETLQ